MVLKRLRNESKRAARRAWPIHGYVGANGGGKSAAMVWDTLASLDAGRPVLGTVRLLDYDRPRECDDAVCADDPTSGHYVRALPDSAAIRTAFDAASGVDRIALLVELGDVVGVHKAAHPLWIPLQDWQQVLDARGVDLLLDEVTGAASSRESHSLPAPIANKLVQLRRNDVVVRWSAPSWARADKIIRECSQAVTYCQGYLAKATVSEGGERMWRNRRLFKWKTYDAAQFEDFTVGKRSELGALTVDWHWGPGSAAFAAYDTFDSVLTVGTVNEGGSCYRCGGTRRRPACKCPDNHDEAGAMAGGPARGPRVRGAQGAPLARVPSVGVGDELSGVGA